MPHRIGYIDDNLDNFHANVYLKLARETLAGRGYTITACHGLQRQTGVAWAKNNAVQWFDSVQAMADHVDAFMILAPGTPATHLPLAQQTLPLGKPTFVDKTFAPDLATAQQIFDLADRHGVMVMTSSALRYTQAQQDVREHGPVEHMIAWASGRSFEEYGIHPVEMVVSCMGHEGLRLHRRGDDQDIQLLLDFTAGRTAVVNVHLRSQPPYAALMQRKQSLKYLPVDTSTLFRDALAAIFDFFDSGTPCVDRRETLLVRRILDAAATPEARTGYVALGAK